MTREELIQMPDYWTSQIQLSLYQAAEKFMADNHMNRTQLAAYLGVSKGYVSQLLNGDYNYSISKLVELAIKLHCVPNLHLEPMKPAKKRPSLPIVRPMRTTMRTINSPKRQRVAAML